MRGSSVKEITRDALLEKVSQERELRNYARRANAAALFIQVHFYFLFIQIFCMNFIKKSQGAQPR